jgi:hypothetical protein
MKVQECKMHGDAYDIEIITVIVCCNVNRGILFLNGVIV